MQDVGWWGLGVGTQMEGVGVTFHTGSGQVGWSVSRVVAARRRWISTFGELHGAFTAGCDDCSSGQLN